MVNPEQQFLDGLKTLQDTAKNSLQNFGVVNQMNPWQALTCLAYLKQSLDAFVKLVSEATSVRWANRSPDLVAALGRHRQSLDREREEVGRLKERLEQVTQEEQQVRELISEKQRLEKEIEDKQAELERLRELARAQNIEDLRRQLKRLQDSVTVHQHHGVRMGLGCLAAGGIRWGGWPGEGARSGVWQQGGGAVRMVWAEGGR